MSLNNVQLAGLQRPSSYLLPVVLLLPLSCFKGGNDDVGATETGTESGTDTDIPCDVGTLSCACTNGMGCNPGLECIDNVCEEIIPECSNGVVEGTEQCDDGNQDNTDSCTTECAPPSCDDGIVSGEEIALDCGIDACGEPCEAGQPCTIDNDCIFPICGPDGGDEGTLVCELPKSCAEYLQLVPGATDGNLMIDPDGAAGDIDPFEAFCHQAKDGGGWTLVYVSSDDGVDTWTWNNRAKLAGEADVIGDLENTNLDFMSQGYHNMPVTDVLFIHQPSDVWAHYANVGDGAMTMGQIILAAGSPVCDYELAGMGHELAGGTLTSSGQLCDTDLYFNLGDHEMDLASCMNFGSGSNTASFGPVWSANKNSGCPFDDPAEYALGPHGPCGACPDNFSSTEFAYLGYANALNLNTGAADAGENYMQLYIR